MRLPSLGAAVGLVLWTLGAARPAAAQLTPRLAHGDVSVSIGWLRVNEKGLSDEAGWRTDQFFRAVEVGWYWTEQLKTTIETSPELESYAYARKPVVLEGRQFDGNSYFDTHRRRLTLTQHYQFGHNQWLHPFVAGGVAIVRDRTTRSDREIFDYQPNRPPRLVRGAIEHPEQTSVYAQGLAAAGVKAYMHRRVFFISDLRLGFSSRLGEVLVRAGVGVDF